MNIRKRKVDRILVDLSAHIEVLHRKLECRLVDISGTGAAIHVSKSAPLMVGNQIHLIFSLADEPLTYITYVLKGKVVYIAPTLEDMELNRIGIEFYGISEKDKKSLEKLRS